MPQLRLPIALIAACALIGSACGRSEPAHTDTTAAASPSDSTVTLNIQARYFGDETIKGRNIDVDTKDGVVTLSGTVPNDAARQQAETIAKGVAGVTEVRNNLTVATADANAPDAAMPDRTNAGWITTKIQAQYFASTDVRGRNIDVTTSPEGRVTLAGHVESQAERDAALRIAREADGVRDVQDRLEVRTANANTSAGESSGLGDPWITMKIQSKYFLDGDVKGRRIDVTTQNGVVTLTGEVSSAEERRKALLLARATDGVARVEDQLRVTEPAAATKPAAPKSDATLQDEWIELKIQSKYFLEDDLNGMDIDVKSVRGVVTLTGRVSETEARKIAEEIATETDGVRSVVNRIQITSGGQ